MTPSRLLPWLGVLLLALFAMMSPALAQTADEKTADASGQSPPSYEALADLLENDQSREQLIERLRSEASTLPNTLESELSPEAAAQGGNLAPEDVSLPRQLAELTSRVVGDVGTQLE